MRAFVLVIAALLSTAFVAFGQYAPQEEQPVVEDVTLSKAYKSAKGVMIWFFWVHVTIFTLLTLRINGAVVFTFGRKRRDCQQVMILKALRI